MKTKFKCSLSLLALACLSFLEPGRAQVPSQPVQAENLTTFQQLSALIKTRLEPVLSLLGNKVEMPRQELLQIQTKLGVEIAAVNPANKQRLQAALAVCAALSTTMDERDKAVSNFVASNKIHPTADLGGASAGGSPYYSRYYSNGAYYYDYPTRHYVSPEEEQKRIKQKQNESDAGTTGRAEARWKQRGNELRQYIQQAYLRASQLDNTAPQPAAQNYPLGKSDAKRAGTLKDALVGSKWTWHGAGLKYTEEIAFFTNGTGKHTYTSFSWAAYGPRTVELTRPDGVRAVITFDDNFTTYSGTDFDGKRTLTGDRKK